MKIVASVCTERSVGDGLTEFSIAVNFIRTVFWTNGRASFIGLAQTNAHCDTPRQLNRTNHATKPYTSNKRLSGTSRALMRKYHERVYSLKIRELSRDLRETVKRSSTDRITRLCRKVLRYFNDNLNYSISYLLKQSSTLK